jgi:protein SCO1
MRREVEGGDPIYFLSHSDKILLIDERSRLVFDYGGSMTPVNIIAEDLAKL